MIITPTNNSSTVSNVSINGNTMDMLTYVQALLLQDSDSQLKDMGKKMQANLSLKKAYRNDISKLEIALSKVQSEGKKNDSGKYYIQDGSVNPNPQPFLTSLGLSDFSYGIVKDHIYDTEANNGLGAISSTDSAMSFIETDTETRSNGQVSYLTTIYDNRLEEAAKYLENKVEDLNTQSEQLQLQLQDLTGKRKTALDTLSSLFSKVADTNGSIIRNIGK